jgi:hypothetical protein
MRDGVENERERDVTLRKTPLYIIVCFLIAPLVSSLN